jgi:EAL domain-containing protein (putative c-di-GMP-specific phosphodiesterase class I)
MPDNDTRVAEAVAQWPDMRICLNFPSSVHLREPEEIRRVAEEILAEGGATGRLQIQISENVPPGVWRKSFPAIVTAIRAFGRPRTP